MAVLVASVTLLQSCLWVTVGGHRLARLRSSALRVTPDGGRLDVAGSYCVVAGRLAAR